MIERRDPQYILATLGATASILGCIAISLATVGHAQVATPRFYAQATPAPVVQAACADGCSSVVISR